MEWTRGRIYRNLQSLISATLWNNKSHNNYVSRTSLSGRLGFSISRKQRNILRLKRTSLWWSLTLDWLSTHFHWNRSCPGVVRDGSLSNFRTFLTEKRTKQTRDSLTKRLEITGWLPFNFVVVRLGPHNLVMGPGDVNSSSSLPHQNSPNFSFERSLFYYESRKRELKTKPTYECRYDERLKTKSEKSTRLSYTGFLLKTRFLRLIYYEWTKRKLKTIHICECRCYERLQTKTK
jgi:hypothetical protein